MLLSFPKHFTSFVQIKALEMIKALQILLDNIFPLSLYTFFLNEGK